MQVIKFSLPFPPSVNVKYQQSRGKRATGEAVKKWRIVANNWLNIQNILPVNGRVLLEYSLYTPDNYRRDCGNYEKYITDFLVERGILQDDSARYIKGIFTYWNDKIGDTVEIKITPL